MIKRFLAKLTSWNAERNKGWQKSAAERFKEESAELQNLAREREQMRKANMRDMGILPRKDIPTEERENREPAA